MNTVTNWLQAQPPIHLVARDGSRSYQAAISNTSSSILQISDRFHLVQNLYKVMKEMIQRLLPSHWEKPDSSNNRLSIPITSLNEKEEAKWQLIQVIQKEKQLGLSMRGLAKKYKISRNTVKKYLETNQPLTYSPRIKRSINTTEFQTSIVEGLEKKQSITAIFQQLQQQGFTGSYTAVRNAINQMKRTPVQTQLFSRRRIISLFWRNHAHLTVKEQQQLHQTLTIYPVTQEIYAFVQLFREAYQTLDFPYFLRLKAKFQSSKLKEITRYLSMIREDLEAIKAAFFYTYNTSIVEGQINRLKMIKRLMYGRASLELLEKRVLLS